MTQHDRLVRIGLIVVALALVALVAACGGKGAKVKSDTALGNYDLAASSVATATPDAKLLMVQNAMGTKPGEAPTWVYVFGSPSKGTMYSVSVRQGLVMDVTDSGKAPLESGEWADVPGISKWKIDSDKAYDKAYEVSGAKSAPNSYSMLLETYIPKSAAESKTEPFTWYFSFDPGESGATDKIIKVNAETGEASVTE